MIWEIGIFLIIAGYFVAYRREGLTHPVPMLLAYWLIMFPFKYFLFRYMHLEFTGSVPAAIVDEGSMMLFLFLAASVFAHWFFSRLKPSFPLVEAVPRIGFVGPSVVLVVLVMAIAVGAGGLAVLRDSMKFRELAQRGAGGYIELALLITMTIAIVPLSARRNKWPLFLFIASFSAYGILLGTTGFIILLATTYLGYLCMVERIVPTRALLLGGIVLAPLALLQGILRMAGGFSALKTVQTLSLLANSKSATLFIGSAFGARVNQLEAFSLFADDLRSGIIKTDPLSPLYIFCQVIPRSAWPDKPELFADQMTWYVAPRTHAAHIVFNFVGPAELMYAFGAIAGILLTAALFGYLFSVIDRYYIFCRNRPAAYLFLVVTVIAFLGSGSQDGFFNSMAMLELIVSIIVLALFFRFVVRAPDGKSLETQSLAAIAPSGLAAKSSSVV